MTYTTPIINSATANMIIFAVTFSLYNIMLKNSKRLLILLLWAGVISNLMYFIPFLIAKYVLNVNIIRHISAVELTKITLTDIPIYAATGLLWVAAHVVLKNLYQRYSIAAVAPLLELSIVFTAIGLYALGTPVKTKGVIGILLVLIGAMVSGMREKGPKEYLRDLRMFGSKLMGSATTHAFITATMCILGYIIQGQRAFADRATDFLRALPTIHTAYTHPICHEMGSKVFMATSLLIYLLIREKQKRNIIDVLKKNFPTVLLTALLQFVFTYSHQTAYSLTRNKTLFATINRTTGPLMLLFGYLILKEKPTKQEIIGSGIILLGAAAWLA